MRVVFFGSPEFAVPILSALAGVPAFDVRLVVTQAAKGFSPVERAALELSLPVYKPDSLRLASARAPIVSAEADIFVVAAFGLIFGQRTLNIPLLGSINVHPSLLPRYRGASPIMAAIESGDEVTGVSLMEMSTGIDTGDVVSQETEVVAGDDTTASLSSRLAALGARMVVRDVPRWASGELRARPQGMDGASLTRPLTKLDGLVDWCLAADQIERHVRAMWPWPRAWTTVDGSPLQIHRAQVAPGGDAVLEPGEVVSSKRQIVVACGNGALELLEIEPAGRRAMSAAAYLNGRRSPLVRLGDPKQTTERPPLIAPIVVPEVGNPPE